ncbi:UV DNA damage repair endonuclease UvsE [Clostridium sp. D2Q-11]|uniref:UV DNA damage repair endonuclease UvsE n=1 Tax=Anaeromonas frigoriresistens TaxID=2683708 RepID=A0A942ZA69_9FIRM|nr:UV DNA damage repair endonuclease UvsE [Anaeromonas frigoriresistens]MBS4539919.1 UV DNA damage repair endonuclease UvsE [Anaeromonas frigoriresistens]
MLIRFGYVAMAIDLKNCSPSKTMTYTNYEKMKDSEVKLYKLKKITKENLINTKRILLYNVASDIKVYRLSSRLVPLVTHSDVIDWDYTKEFQEIYKSISKIINDNKLRVSMHPDHFTIISSPKDNVVEKSIEILEYHNNIMSSMDLSPQDGKLVLHIGGKYDGKEKTKKRFVENFLKLPEDIKSRIIVENDDKIYDVEDVLEVCRETKVPMVLDIHHHWCNNRDKPIGEYLEEIFNTWKSQPFPPKVHLSSPKDEKNFRAHHDYIDYFFFKEFIDKAKNLNQDFDIMIEAKKKNLALVKLIEDIKKQQDYQIINNATIKA